jgi:hypothetical protein
MKLEDALTSVWKQALAEGEQTVRLNGQQFPVRFTPKKHLRQVNFRINSKEIRGLEQNPKTASRWAQLARQGHKIMQFLSEGQYIANVADGKLTLYKRRGQI